MSYRNKQRTKRKCQSPSHNPGMVPSQEDQCLAIMEKMNIHIHKSQRPEMEIEPISENVKEWKIVEGEEEDNKSIRGVEKHWEEFSDSEEEQEALKLTVETEVELMKEYADFQTPRKVTIFMQTPSPPSSKKRRIPVKTTSAKKKSPASRRLNIPGAPSTARKTPPRTTRMRVKEWSQQPGQTVKDTEFASQTGEMSEQPKQTDKLWRRLPK
jgi:hypothetical protein